jgi:dihydroxyacetone kinase
MNDLVVSVGSVSVMTNGIMEHGPDYYARRMLDRIDGLIEKATPELQGELKSFRRQLYVELVNSIQAIQLAERARVAQKLRDKGLEVSARLAGE